MYYLKQLYRKKLIYILKPTLKIFEKKNIDHISETDISWIKVCNTTASSTLLIKDHVKMMHSPKIYL